MQMKEGGYNSCAVCDDPGEHVDKHMVFGTSPGQVRSTQQFLDLWEEGTVMEGFHNLSVLTFLPHFDLIDCCCIDSMHCLFEGLLVTLL